ASSVYPPRRQFLGTCGRFPDEAGRVPTHDTSVRHAAGDNAAGGDNTLSADVGHHHHSLADPGLRADVNAPQRGRVTRSEPPVDSPLVLLAAVDDADAVANQAAITQSHNPDERAGADVDAAPDFRLAESEVAQETNVAVERAP